MRSYKPYLRHIALVLVGWCLTLLPAAAQGGIQVEANAPLQVLQGEPFRIEFIASTQQNDIGEAQFTPPAWSGLDIMSGPVSSTGTYMSITNGATQVKKTLTYTYWVKAQQTGTIRIPAATITVAGRDYQTKALTVESLSADQAGRGQGNGTANQRDNRNNAATNGKTSVNATDILLRMEVNKSEVYRGEPLVASLKIYTQVNIAGFENVKYPALNGFWAQEMDVSGQGDGRTTLGGKEYHSQVLRQWLLYPQRSGTLEIEQAQFTAIAQLVSQAQTTGSPFDIFFNAPQVKNVSVKLASPVVNVRVKELPKPMPADFTGAVGQFDLTGVISGDRFAANTAGSITLRLSGTGNFPLIEAPKIDLPAAFEQFDMKTNEQLATTAKGTSGEKTFEFPFIARAEGQYTLPGVQFSYFDPVAGTYKHLSTPDFDVEILRDESGGTSGLGMVSGVTKEDLKILGSDIRFIRIGNPRLVPQGRAFLWSWGWFLTLVLLVVAFVATLLYLRKNIRDRADVVRVKTKKANKVALRRLKQAKIFMNDGKESLFFEELLRALWGYMGDKLAIDVANLTKERVLAELVERRGIAEEQAKEFLSLIADCEFAQYSPAAGIQMEKAYQAALDLIGRFESKI